jgi:hypothetical protein
MQTEELYEEIRALLREPLTSTPAAPWRYTDAEFVPQVRSVLRKLKAVGVTTSAEMNEDGDFTTAPDDTVGLLLAYGVASRLLTGDMTRKLQDGEMGTYWRAGPDILDTKDVAKLFANAAAKYDEEFRAMLTMILTDADGGANSYFGESSAQASS